MAAANNDATSAGSHRAGHTSAGEHRAGHNVVALMSYNVGIHNNEVNTMYKPSGKYEPFKADIIRALTSEHGNQIMLKSEFGNMIDSIDKKLRSS